MISQDEIKMLRGALRSAKKSAPVTNRELHSLLSDTTRLLDEVCSLRGAIRAHKASVGAGTIEQANNKLWEEV